MTALDNLDAERAVIGGSLLTPSLLSDVLLAVTPLDFFSSSHQTIFAAIEARHRAGDSIDPTVIAGDVGATVTDASQVLAECITRHASSQATTTHARTVADLAAVRRIALITDRASESIRSGVTDPGSLLDSLTTDLSSVDLPMDPRPVEGLWRASELLGKEFPEPDYVIPGYLRLLDRMIVVGLEGSGKSWWLSQLAVATALGINAFTFAKCEPRRTLIVDCENHEADIRDRLRACKRLPGSPDAPITILARPGGIDVRTRRDRDLLHRVCEDVRPELVCIGPLYKMFRTDKGETDEQASTACQNVIDDLRTRFGFAVALEHHAPKGSDIRRPMVPFGSSTWMRWPEFGWGLVPVDPRTGKDAVDGPSLRINGFRRDRSPVERPVRFDRGGSGSSWPWVGHWPGRVQVPDDAYQDF